MHLRDTLHLIAREARHHPGRVGVALLAIALGSAVFVGLSITKMLKGHEYHPPVDPEGVEDEHKN